jgi:hypothetical protein
MPQAQHIDWNTLQIVERQDEEGRLEVIDEDQLYNLLGLTVDVETPSIDGMGNDGDAGRVDSEAGRVDGEAPHLLDDSFGAEIPVDDDVPEERVFVHDPDKPSMSIGTVYPDMKEFRLAMRQFAINEEFELHIAKTDRARYIGYCKGDGCPWHIVGRRQPDGKTVMVFFGATIRLLCFLYIACILLFQ